MTGIDDTGAKWQGDEAGKPAFAKGQPGASACRAQCHLRSL
eukprot:CAMPEP_0172881872 /NCGR_PEP_ID=MMETSP1075-20121228/118642_1 /TAXON_ID=2916 /ORGANISM="Ceratium fusus, Strain PA161109" /LENGTH=40 /DNA_ID= /DNA_START= /DNA_END= /DNA_ORIENTATION=